MSPDEIESETEAHLLAQWRMMSVDYRIAVAEAIRELGLYCLENPGRPAPKLAVIET